jgi:hypothetical protein
VSSLAPIRNQRATTERKAHDVVLIDPELLLRYARNLVASRREPSRGRCPVPGISPGLASCSGTTSLDRIRGRGFFVVSTTPSQEEKIMEKISQRLFSWASILDTKARDQAQAASTMPFIHPHLALMPDAHLGKGATVG